MGRFHCVDRESKHKSRTVTDRNVTPFKLTSSKLWWARRESNPRPIGYEPTALTSELRAPRNLLTILIAIGTRQPSLPRSDPNTRRRDPSRSPQQPKPPPNPIPSIPSIHVSPPTKSHQSLNPRNPRFRPRFDIFDTSVLTSTPSAPNRLFSTGKGAHQKNHRRVEKESVHLTFQTQQLTTEY